MLLFDTRDGTIPYLHFNIVKYFQTKIICKIENY